MTQPRKPIRSREDRVLEKVPGEEDSPESIDDVELRDMARSKGYRLVRDPRVPKEKRVQTCLYISKSVRRGMEASRYELGMSFSDMVDRGVVMLLESHGLRVEGWIEP